MNVLVIGVGRIGGGLVYELVKHGGCTIWLYGRNYLKTQGLAVDLREVNSAVSINVLEQLSEMPSIDITVFAFSELQWHADIQVNDRIIDARTNLKIIDNIAAQVSLNALGTIIIISNPVDILSRYCYEKYGAVKVYGFGNALDELRLNNSIHPTRLKDGRSKCICIGEHGSSMVPVLSPVLNDEQLNAAEYNRIKTLVFERTQEIIQKVSIPFYAPLYALTELILTMLNKESKQLTLSCYLHSDYKGQSGLSIGVPVEIQSGNIGSILSIELSEYEQSLFEESAQSLRNQYKQLLM